MAVNIFSITIFVSFLEMSKTGLLRLLFSAEIGLVEERMGERKERKKDEKKEGT